VKDRCAELSTRQMLLLVTAITLLAAGFRFYHIGDKSFWLDEGTSWAIAHSPAGQFWHRLWSQEFNMVAYYELLRMWLHLGSSEAVIRALSALSAIATVPVLYELGNHLFDRYTGLVAALLLAVHPAHVAYSQEARGYTLAILLCLLSTRLFVRMMELPGWNMVALYALVSTLAIYTHFLAALIFPAQAVSLLAWRKGLPWRRLLVAAAAISILAVPAAIFVLTRNIGQLAWIKATNWHTPLQLAGVLLGSAVCILCFAVLGIIAVREFARLRGSQNAWPYALVISWAVTPLLLLLVLSLRKPVLTPRFLLICLPALMLLAARGADLLRPSRWSLAILSLLVVLLVALLPGYYKHRKEDWRAVTGYVLSAAQPGDAVLVWYPEPFQYYARGSQVSIQEFDSRSERIHAGLPLEAFAAKYPRAWVVNYDWWADDANFRADNAALARSYRIRQERTFPGGIEVARYAH